MALIFVFLDGLGLAPASSTNPLATTPMPALHALLGGPLTSEQVQAQSALLLRPIDATLGVAGLPQSGTGHIALLAGVNAPALHGKHQPNFPPVALRPLLAEQSIFRRTRTAGRRAAFANAFTPGYWQAIAARRMRRSASIIAAEGAELHMRTLDDLAAGAALSWDITGEAVHRRGEGLDLPLIAPVEAGRRLSRLADSYDLVFFESFLPDLAGHGRLGPNAVTESLRRIDGLIGGLLAACKPNDTVLITSDHGNLEDTTTRVHTLNPVPLLVVGPAMRSFAGVERIDQVADAIMTDMLTQA
jgi:2,3-bisphosphoglycerate-independent phosphoglycerate mutase